MADTSTFDNFFDNFPPKSGFATKGYHYSVGGNEHLLQSKMFGEYCCKTLCTVFKDDFIFVQQTLPFLLLEQCNPLSLLDEIGWTFFAIDNFSISPNICFFQLVICRSFEKNVDISAIDFFSGKYRPPLNIAHLNLYTPKGTACHTYSQSYACECANGLSWSNFSTFYDFAGKFHLF